MARRGARKAKAQAGQEPSSEHFSKSKTLPGWECDICRPRPPVMNTIQALAHEQTPGHSEAVAVRWSGPLEPDAEAWDAPVPPERESVEGRILRGLEHRGWVDTAQERIGFWLRGVERAKRGLEPESMDKFVGELEREQERRRRDNDWGVPAPEGWGDGAQWSNDGKNGWGAWDQDNAGWENEGSGSRGKEQEKEVEQNGWDAWDATMQAGPSRPTPAQDNPAGQHGWDTWKPTEQTAEPQELSCNDNPAGQNGWDLWDPTAKGAVRSPDAAWTVEDNPGGQYGWEPWDPTQAHDGGRDWFANGTPNTAGQYAWDPWDPTADANKGTVTPKKSAAKAWAQPKLWVHPATSRESSPASVGKVARQDRRQREPFSKVQTGRNTQQTEYGPGQLQAHRR